MDSIEYQIKERFNELYRKFPEEIVDTDPKLKVVLDFFGDIKNKQILDVGCGKGRFAKQLIKREAKVTGIDPAEKFIEEARRIGCGNFKVGSATNIPFSDNSFDYILCIEVIDSKKRGEDNYH